MDVARMRIYILEFGPYRNYNGTILFNHVKLIVWAEIIIQYPMDWYHVLHSLLIKLLLFIVHHIFSLNKPRHVCCSIFFLSCIRMYLFMSSCSVVLQ